MEENKTAAPKKSYKRMPRRRVCAFCQEKVTEIDYKDISRLKKFVAESGKIMPSRMTGNISASFPPQSNAQGFRLCFPSKQSKY